MPPPKKKKTHNLFLSSCSFSWCRTCSFWAKGYHPAQHMVSLGLAFILHPWRVASPPEAEPEAELALQTQPWQSWTRNLLGSGICSPDSVLRFFFVWMCCRNTASSSWGRQTSPPDRELIAACRGLWVAVSVQNFGPLTPRLGKCRREAAKRSGASELNSLRKITKNADRRAPRESKWAETARVGVREWGNGKR